MRGQCFDFHGDFGILNQSDLENLLFNLVSLLPVCNASSMQKTIIQHHCDAALCSRDKSNDGSCLIIAARLRNTCTDDAGH